MSDEEAPAGELNPWILSSYFIYSGILLLKLFLNLFLIAIARSRTKIMSNPEDLNLVPKEKRKDYKVGVSNSFLTRVLRMQRNDLENIIPFFILGYMYAMTWYTPYWRARLHYRIFVGARLLHSFCHFFAIQPLRTLFYIIAMSANVSLAIHILYKVGRLNYI